MADQNLTNDSNLSAIDAYDQMMKGYQQKMADLNASRMAAQPQPVQQQAAAASQSSFMPIINQLQAKRAAEEKIIRDLMPGRR